jgi:hypothetical protein
MVDGKEQDDRRSVRYSYSGARPDSPRSGFDLAVLMLAVSIAMSSDASWMCGFVSAAAG